MSDSETPTPSEVDRAEPDTVVGGEVQLADEPLETFDPRPVREGVAKWLAITFAVALGLSFVLHYVGTLVLACLGKADAVAAIKPIFEVWLPVISSLTSSAATFYFTKER